jgi:TonB family protein
MGNRGFATAFGISVAVHLTLLVGQAVPLPRLRPATRRIPLEVIYQLELEEERNVREQISRALRQGEGPGAPLTEAVRAEIRVPDRLALPELQLSEQAQLAESTHVDLTDLVAASQGNPVLLSYFSAIREQIQRAANQQVWFTGLSLEGVVYVTFILHAGGQIEGAAVLAEQSVRSEALRQIAVRIVQASAPFPPFPPSLREPKKLILVPLEFLLTSSR